MPPYMVLFGFLGTWISGVPMTSEESIAVAWVPFPDVLARITHPAIHDRVKDMLEYSGRVIYRTYTVDPYTIHEQCYYS